MLLLILPNFSLGSTFLYLNLNPKISENDRTVEIGKYNNYIVLTFNVNVIRSAYIRSPNFEDSI